MKVDRSKFSRKFLSAHFSSGGEVKELIPLKKSELVDFYFCAKEVFEKGRFQDAADAFVFLATHSPFEYAFWMGLGLAELAQSHLDAALAALWIAAVVNPRAPAPYYYLSKCYFAQEKQALAIEMVEEGEKRALEGENDHDITLLLKEAKAFLKNL